MVKAFFDSLVCECEEWSKVFCDEGVLFFCDFIIGCVSVRYDEIVVCGSAYCEEGGFPTFNPVGAQFLDGVCVMLGNFFVEEGDINDLDGATWGRRSADLRCDVRPSCFVLRLTWAWWT